MTITAAHGEDDAIECALDRLSGAANVWFSMSILKLEPVFDIGKSHRSPAGSAS